MAVTPHISGTGGTPGVAFELMFRRVDGHPAPTKLAIRNRTGATASLEVQIPELHGADGFATIEAGQVEDFFVNGGFTTVLVRGDGAIVDWYGVSYDRE